MTLSHYLEYFLLRVLQTGIGLLPRGAALTLGGCIGTCLYHCGVYRKIVGKNMDYTTVVEPKNRELIIKSLYKNMGRYWADILRPSVSLPPHTIHNFDAAQAVFARGKGTLFVLAHFGNWEVLAPVFGEWLGDLNVLARPMHNRLVEQWLFKKRSMTHTTPIYDTQALFKILRVLKRNGMVAMLIDQYSGSQGTMALFLGKPANTIRTVAGLLEKTDCGIIFVYALMEKDGSYRIEIEEGPAIIPRPQTKDRFIAAYQKAHNDVLSRWIAANPDHYFGWFHRRFKDSIAY